MQAKYSIAAFILIFVMVSGCWNRREVNDIEYVLASGIDQTSNKQIVVTVQTPVLEAIKPDSKLNKVVNNISMSGPTTMEAVRDYTNVTGHQLYWAHLRTCLLGENAAKLGIESYLDFFSANRELRGIAKMAVIKGKAKDIISAGTNIQTIPADYINDVLTGGEMTGESPTVSLSEFNRMLADPVGSQPYLPAIKLFQADEYDKSVVHTAPYKGPGADQAPVIKSVGTAVFHMTRLVGYLNLKETRGLLWVQNKLQTTTVVVPCRDEPCSITLEVMRAKSSVKVKYSNDKAVVHVKVQAETNIGDKASKEKIVEQDYIKYLEKAFAVVVKDEIESAFRKSVLELHSDIFGYGNRISDTDLRTWKEIKDEWEDRILPNAELHVEVVGKLRRTTRTISSPWVPKGL